MKNFEITPGKKLIYKGLPINNGEHFSFKMKGRNVYNKGAFHISDKRYLYLNSNIIEFNGGHSTYFGYKYSWAMGIANDEFTVGSERDLIIIPDYISDIKVKISNRIKIDKDIEDFISFHSNALFIAMKSELNFLKKYDRISVSEKEEFIILHYTKNDKLIKVEMKINRFFNKLLSEFEKIYGPNTHSHIESDIEELYNLWISSKEALESETLKGKDIVKGYSNSFSKIRSCMTGLDTRLALYTENPDKIGLKVFKHENKVIARTIIWNGDDGHQYHDRLYIDNNINWLSFRIFKTLRDEGFSSIYNSKVTVTLNDNFTKEVPYLDNMTLYNHKMLKNY